MSTTLLTLLVHQGRFDLAPYQAVLLVELDGSRSRQAMVQRWKG